MSTLGRRVKLSGVVRATKGATSGAEGTMDTERVANNVEDEIEETGGGEVASPVAWAAVDDWAAPSGPADGSDAGNGGGAAENDDVKEVEMCVGGGGEKA